MRNYQKSRSIWLLIATCGILSGCFATTLPENPQPESLSRLVAAAPRQRTLLVRSDLDNGGVGYQFLLFGLPVGRIYAPATRPLVASAMRARAGLAGLGLADPSDTPPMLSIDIVDLSVHGYDFLLFRRPYARIRLRGSLASSDDESRECDITEESAHFAKFAFERDLSEALQSAADKAAARMLSCLGLVREHEAVAEDE